MSDGNPGNQAGICGLNLYSEFRLFRYIRDIRWIMCRSWVNIALYREHIRMRVPRTKHKEKGIPIGIPFN